MIPFIMANITRDLNAAIKRKDYEDALIHYEDGGVLEHTMDPVALIKSTLNDTEKAKYLHFVLLTKDEYRTPGYIEELLRVLMLDTKEATVTDCVAACLKYKFDINKPFLQSPKDGKIYTLLSTACLHDHSNKMLEQLCEKGADPKKDNQIGLSYLILNRKFALAEILLANGADVNAGDGKWFAALMIGLVKACTDDECKMDKLAGDVINFAMANGASPTKFLWHTLEHLKNCQWPERAAPLIEYFESLKTDAFDKMAPITVPENPTREDLLKPGENGFPILDGLAAQGKLSDLFNRARWKGRERDGIELHGEIMPEFQNENAIADLKIHAFQSPQKSAGIKRRPAGSSI